MLLIKSIFIFGFFHIPSLKLPTKNISQQIFFNFLKQKFFYLGLANLDTDHGKNRSLLITIIFIKTVSAEVAEAYKLGTYISISPICI